MNPTQIIAIGNVAVQLAGLYAQLRVNHSDLPTFEDLLAKADTNFDAVAAQAEKEING